MRYKSRGEVYKETKLDGPLAVEESRLKDETDSKKPSIKQETKSETPVKLPDSGRNLVEPEDTPRKPTEAGEQKEKVTQPPPKKGIE